MEKAVEQPEGRACRAELNNEVTKRHEKIARVELMCARLRGH